MPQDDVRPIAVFVRHDEGNDPGTVVGNISVYSFSIGQMVEIHILTIQAGGKGGSLRKADLIHFAVCFLEPSKYRHSTAK